MSLSALLSLPFLPLFLLGWLFTAHASAADLLVAFVGPETSSAYLGARQGVEEANILGRFTGQTYSLKTFTVEQLLPSPTSTLAVAAAVQKDALLKLSQALEDRGIPVFNVSAQDNSLRKRCRSNLLHTIPSRRMLADAAAQWRKKNPSAGVEAQAWHPEFVKFAARDLNKRFREAQNTEMNDEAWAGWAAVKMLSDAVARSQTTEPREVLTHLREEMEFDGQKGSPMTFRDNGQLRQPLLLVEDGKLVGEAPVRGVVDTDNLDTLGRPSCRDSS